MLSKIKSQSELSWKDDSSYYSKAHSYQKPQAKTSEMAKNFARLAVPSVITNLFNYMVMTANTVFAGNFEHDSAAKLAGVGLGTMFLGMFCRHILTGINCAQETLVGPAYGQGQLKLCGTYLNRGRAIITVAYIPLLLLMCFSEKVLVSLGQNALVATYAFNYI